jgi:predicted membrane chloride channel (bestrophin family)
MNFHHLSLIINLKSIIVVITALLSTVLCINYEIIANFPLALISTAIVFPIVFSIGGAYKRREVVLSKYGSIKGLGRAIFFATRDWVPEKEEASINKLKKQLGDLLKSFAIMFSRPIHEIRENEKYIYTNFSNLSQFIKKDLRERGLASGEVSRCNQFLSKMMVAFEDIKHIYQYRTPRSLRAFSKFFILILPTLYGPYFAKIGQDCTPGLQYVMPVLLSLILVSLDNIQDHLENPFDQHGEDDVKINSAEFVKNLL